MKSIALTLIILFVAPGMANAATNASLRLHSEPLTLAPGDEAIVEVRVEEMAPVYGAELALSFNPDILEVVDSDSQTQGVQIMPGTFFDLSKSHFPLQNLADNSEGSVRYAVSMLNPAPAAQGNGVVARIALRSKTLGRADVRVSKSIFGTRDGKAIVPGVQNKLTFQIAENKAWFFRPSMRIGVAIIFLATILLVIFRKASSRQKE